LPDSAVGDHRYGWPAFARALKEALMDGRFPACALAATLMLGGTLFPGSARAEDERGVVVFAQGGGYSPVTDLDDAGSASFKTGFADMRCW
jgi:hypothetical protein